MATVHGGFGGYYGACIPVLPEGSAELPGACRAANGQTGAFCEFFVRVCPPGVREMTDEE